MKFIKKNIISGQIFSFYILLIVAFALPLTVLASDFDISIVETVLTDNKTNLARVNNSDVTAQRQTPSPDTIKPTVAINTPINGGNYKSITVPTLSYTISDNTDPNPVIATNGYLTTEGTHTLTVTATDKSENTGSKSVTYTVDNTAPKINLYSPMKSPNYLLNKLSNACWTATDKLSGIKKVNATTNCIDYFDTSTAGSNVYWIFAEDEAGNLAFSTINYNVTYDFSGFLPPINNNGSSVFKLGSIIPVKFQTKDAYGINIPNAPATISIVKYFNNVKNSIDGEDNMSCAAKNVDFRCDFIGNQYIYNLSTKTLSEGSYIISANIGDGTNESVKIQLRK